MGNIRAGSVQLLMLLLGASAGTVAGADERARQAAATGLRRDFVVFLDNRQIGTHRFEVFASDGKPAAVSSVARFDVKILGIRAYRYRHEAQEQWRDGCLVSLKSTTDDNGALSDVDAALASDLLQVRSGSKNTQFTGCVMTYAYWNPAFLRQRQLLNPQTGNYDDVSAELLGRETIEAGHSNTLADHYRVHASSRTIDVWYTPTGEWLQLDSTVAGGKLLRYRLP